MRILRLDFETYSEIPLNGTESVGVWNYANHLSTQVLMAAYKLPGSPIVQLWQPHLDTMPQILRDNLTDSDVVISAFNSAFERYILQFVLGITVPVKRFIDPQVSARYLSMPGDLDEVSTILGLPEHLAKDKRGDELIKLFCEPQLAKKKRGQEQTYYKADWTTHPEEWKAFCEYCKQDVVAEEEVSRRMEMLEALPLPPFERRLWEFDQTVNDRGMPVDREFVEKAYRLATRSKKEALDRQNAITGLENANSTDQLKPWLKARGYPFNTLRKETVDSVLKDPDVKLTPEARQVLVARREASSTSYQKLNAILRQLSPDNRLRGQFVFMGAPRTGRWAGNAVQLQNMARPGVVGEIKDDKGNVIEKGYDFEDLAVMREAREMVRREDYDGIKAKYKSVLLVIKNVLRTVFVAPEGYRFNVCDLNAIEIRDGAWIAQCADLMNVFIPLQGKPNGRDPYLNFATKLYSISNEKLEADYASKDPARKGPAKRQRQIAKPAVLAAQFRQSGGGWGRAKKGYKDHGDDCNANDTYTEQSGKVKKIGKKCCSCPTIYDKVKTGLWKYAEDMGVDMTQEQAVMSVRVFRESYPEIPNCWYAIENAVTDVMKGQDTVRRVGPNGCIIIDKINIEGRHSLLRMQLPSGRFLHYIDARIEPCLMPWKDDQGNDVYRDALVHAGMNQDTKQWDTFVQSHGGKQYENLVQAIARDILAVCLLEFEKIDAQVVGHAHDEGITLVPDDPFSPGVEDMVKIMSTPIDWAPGLLLGADGFEEKFYHK